MRSILLPSLLLPLLCLSPRAFSADDTLPNPGFETPGGWEVVPENGATGSGERDTSLARSGSAAMRLTKTNGRGWLDLRTAQPVQLRPGVRYRFRAHFRSESATLANLLLLRFGPKDGSLSYDAIDASAGWMSQSLLINSPPGQWEVRVGHHQAKEPEEIYLHVVLYGNPCTAWLDDLELTTEPFKITSQHSEFAVPYTPEQVTGILKLRPDATAQVVVRDGRSTLLVNGEPTPPILYKGEPYHVESDLKRFGEQGVGLATVSVRLGTSAGFAGVWQGQGRYDFSIADAALTKALQRNPRACLVLDLWFYPYPAWGAENPEECWANGQGERGYGSWGNLDGFAKDLAQVPNGDRCWWYPSYYSARWRADAAEAARALIAHLRQTPLWKPVVGVFISGGHDGQFQVFSLNDYSPASRRSFAQYLGGRYATPDRAAHVWHEPLGSFDAVQVPPEDPFARAPGATPYLGPSRALDYRGFAEQGAWDLRDAFAQAVKEAAGKSVFTVAYGSPPEFDFGPFLDLKYLDACGSMSYYPYRNPGYAPGLLIPSSFPLHNKLYFQELDLRSWAGSVHADEVYQTWIGAGLTPETWQDIERKLVGLSLARGQGFWYYDMNHFLDAPEIMAEIGRVQRLTRDLRSRPPTRFRPDVCVVRAPGSDRVVSAYFSAVKHAEFFQEMALESSGVPYDVHYLPDVLARPELQQYKLYVFLHTRYLTTADRQAIRAKLANRGRLLVWVCDPGYVSETGKSVDQLSELVGMKVETEEKFDRLTPLVSSGDNPLTRNVQPCLGLTDLLLATMNLVGSSGFSVSPQPFWVEDPSAKPLATYVENGKVAAAVKSQADWISVYLAAPASLPGDLLNNLARQAGAYVCGPPGQVLVTNGDFLCLHGMRTERCALTLPPTAHQVRNLATNQPVPVQGKQIVLPVTAQKTYWLRFE